MTRMRDIKWPQPTWRLSLTSRPPETRVVQDGTGRATTIVLNRKTRRLLARQNTTHLERLMTQEAKEDHIRHITRTSPTPKQARGRKARNRRKAERLAEQILKG